jgi:hypothetical protein
VRKAIGFDASPADNKRYAHSTKDGKKDKRFTYEYPLREWGWDRAECIRQIDAAGLPVPPKSACFFCPATKPAELHEIPVDLLERIVRLEARAEPRLEGLMDAEGLTAAYGVKVANYEAKVAAFEAKVAKWHRACAVAVSKGKVKMPKIPVRPKTLTLPKMMKLGEGCKGLWRSATKARPAMMTDYIRSAGLLPAERIAAIKAEAPVEIIAFQTGFARAKAEDAESAFLAEHSLEDYRDGSGLNLNFCPLGRIRGEDFDELAATRNQMSNKPEGHIHSVG